MSTNKLPILRNAYPELTRSEKQIADYISDNIDTLMKQTISDIARETNSSEITVSRFCKKLGFSGLQSLKVSLAADMCYLGLANKTYQDITKDDTCKDIAGKIFQTITDGLQDTLRILDFDAVEKAVDMLLSARQILVCGFGNSATVCQDFETRFLRFGMRVHSYADSHQQVTAAAFLTSEDVVFAISHTGATIELLETLKLAKSNGASIITITSHARSPVAMMADVVLNGMGREVNYRSEATASRMIHMAIIDVLYTAVAMKIPEIYKENIKKMRSAIAKKKL